MQRSGEGSDDQQVPRIPLSKSSSIAKPQTDQVLAADHPDDMVEAPAENARDMLEEHAPRARPTYKHALSPMLSSMAMHSKYKVCHGHGHGHVTVTVTVTVTGYVF